LFINALSLLISEQGLRFDVIHSGFEENLPKHSMKPIDYVVQTCRGKAEALREQLKDERARNLQS
jgi:predicted house-cleaning NTP pyrophosphatase (Maf/HAM1 superfamily)